MTAVGRAVQPPWRRSDPLPRRPMRRLLALLVVAVGLAGPAAPVAVAGDAGSAVATPAAVAGRLSARVAQSGARAGRFGGAVVDLDTGAVLWEREGSTLLVPASVAKLATAVAALDLLGPGYRFETTLEARGTFDAATGTLEGDLVLRGSGDPSLSRREKPSDPLWPLSSLAAALAAKGVRAVHGALVLDDTVFDRQGLHPSWPASDLDDWYGAPAGGLSFNDACVTVRVRGGAEEGAPASVTTPCTSGPWPVVSEVRTGAERSAQVGGAFTADRARLRVFGTVGPGVEHEFDVPVPDPVLHAGAAMVAALSAAGVRVTGGARLAASAADRAVGEEVARVEHGLPDVLRTMNRRSQNFYASSVFKACGAAVAGTGTWASGERAVLDALARRGVPVEGARLVDGSGLSKENRLTALALARLLARAERDPLRGPILSDSLAVPGDEGTLQRRFRDAESRRRLRAKTGTLGRSGVHALVGLVDGRDGRRGFAFAFLVNDGKIDGRDLVDALARLLVDA